MTHPIQATVMTYSKAWWPTNPSLGDLL